MPLTTAQKIWIASLASRSIVLARRLAGRGPRVDIVRRGLRWELDLREGIDFSIYLLGAFEPATVRAYSRIVRPGSVVVDIGANIGAHTLFLGRLCGEAGRVIAFEPSRYAFDKLRRNVEINPGLASRISCHQIMLVASEGDALVEEIYSSWPLENTSAASVHTEHKGRLMGTAGATAEPLDDALARLGVGHVDFVKLDVDGHEAQVLKGGSAVFTRCRPVVLVELAPFVFKDDPGEFAFMLEFLWRLGYELEDIASPGEALPRDVGRVVAMIPRGAGINVLGRTP